MKDKSSLLSIVSRLLILFLAAALIFYVIPKIKSASEKEIPFAFSQNVYGDVSLVRGGSYYTLKDDVSIQDGDTVISSSNSGCDLVFSGMVKLTLDENSSIKVEKCTPGSLQIEVAEGAAFFDVYDIEEGAECILSAGNIESRCRETSVLSLESYSGVQTVNVFSGTVDLVCAEEDIKAISGDRAAVIEDDYDLIISQTSSVYSDLRTFLLKELISRGGLCFKTSDLENVLKERENESGVPADENEGQFLSCSLEIRCDVLAGEAQDDVSIPSDGVIFPASPVKFAKGDSVFDVMRKTCKTAGIDIDYDYAVAYTGYKITSIKGISEKKYGNSSGWMYRVNGWYPNYSSSSYVLNDGDVIVWVFTKDGGSDIGQDPW